MSAAVVFEGLESRRLLSGIALNVTQAIVNGAAELRITGSAGADAIGVTRTSVGYQVSNTGGWGKTYSGSYASIRIDGSAGDDSISLDSTITRKTILYGGDGNDTINGGAGADRMFGGAGNDLLRGNSGNDILVTVGGGKRDRVSGGAGLDTFWTDTGTTETVGDVSSLEISSGALHRVSFFANGASKELLSQNLTDPAGGSTSANFSSRPIFSDAGPSADDVAQGNIGDCYFLATLSSIAQTNPTVIRQSLVDLGDGTYAVQFKRDGGSAFVRVDGDLATFSNGSPEFAKLGKQNSLWVAVMEKAFADFRTGESTYDSIEAGWMSEACDALGVSSTTSFQKLSAGSLMSEIDLEMSSGKSVTVAVSNAPKNSGLIGNHAYSVAGVVKDANGNVTGLKLRNPWAVDGYSSSDGMNDGYVTIAPQVAAAALSAVTLAKV